MTGARPDAAVPAILISLAALVLFDVMGLIIKHLSSDYGAAELAAYRNVVGLVPSMIVLWMNTGWRNRGRKLWIRQWPLACFRGLVVTFAQLLFYYALGQMPFATASTLTYANALIMTVLAIPILGEKVGPVRWLAASGLSASFW